MPESLQHKLDRIRSPRVQITYDVEIGNAIEMKELPFVVGIMADLSGMVEGPASKIKDRKFVEIDRDTFNDIMAAIKPRIVVTITDRTIIKKDAAKPIDAKATASKATDTKAADAKAADANSAGKPADIPDINTTSVELFFHSMDDFAPLNIMHQVPALQTMYYSRTLLKDLLVRMDGNDTLHEMLLEIANDKTKLDALAKDLSDAAPLTDPKKILPVGEVPKIGKSLQDFFTIGKLARDSSQSALAVEMLNEYIAQMQKFQSIAKLDTIAFINQRIANIDQIISSELNEIMHTPEFQALEGSWRGLNYLVMNTETSTHLKLRLLNVSKSELLKDLEKAIEFDQSQLFKKIYEEEYGTFGGHPYSCLVGDYEFTRHPQDFALLEKISGVAAAAHAPFITAAHPKLFDLDTFEHLGMPRDLSKIFESLELIKWTSFRNSEDARYVSLVMPKILMRLPYGANTVPVEGLNFEENVVGAESNHFCWGNAAYILAQRITNAFALYGWTAAIRGVEGGGIVEGLPAYTFKTTDGDIALKCPTETAITDRREKELSDLGFIALCHCKGTDYAAFFGGQTCQKPKIYNLDEANANASLSARLPYVLAASRFAHYIKAIMRDKIGSFMTKANVEVYLNTWIANYILLNDDAPQKIKAKYPLREARIDVFDIPGKPGSYRAVVYLRPHFQMEELTASIRLVATLPPPAK